MLDKQMDKSTHKATKGLLDRWFDLQQRGGCLKTECFAGITGFLAVAYLLIVIPGLLSTDGMDKGAVTTGVIVVFVIQYADHGFLRQFTVYCGTGHRRLRAGRGDAGGQPRN